MTQLVVALDQPTYEAALDIVERTAAVVDWYKVGYQAYYGYGAAIITRLQQLDKHVFLDLKLHDIPNTVAAAVRALAPGRPAMLTLHALGGARMLEAALAARAAAADHATAMQLIAVTLLTSIEKQDLTTLGIDVAPEALVQELADAAAAAGMDGVVCAPGDAKAVRARNAAPFVLVCPGIRPQGSPQHDQRRTANPREAARVGADFVVVGRPITAAADPAAAARSILEQCRA